MSLKELREQRWFVSDFHFQHFNILKHANRYFNTIEEMDQILINNFNSVVSKKDLTYIIGDFAWRNHGKYINALNGKKILIRGSHDKMPEIHLRSFTDVRDCLLIKLSNGRLCYMQHTCPRVCKRSHYGAIALWGHSHGRLKTYNLSFDVGVDTSSFTHARYFPYSEWEIIKMVEKREIEMQKQGRIKIENGKTLYFQDDVSYLFRAFKALGFEI